MFSSFGMAVFLLGGLIGLIVVLAQKFEKHNPEAANELKQLIGNKLIAKAKPDAVAKSDATTPDETPSNSAGLNQIKQAGDGRETP